MHEEEICIYNLARTKTDPAEIDRWLQGIGAGGAEIPPGLSGAEEIIGHAGKRCYKSHVIGLNPNIRKIRTDWREYLANVVKSGHGSVLEHAYYTFAIEGVTRVFTAEMNRHRAGVGISEGSMRYISFKDIGFWMPTSIRPTPCPVIPELADVCERNGLVDESVCEEYNAWKAIEQKKALTRDVFRRMFGKAEKYHALLTDIWKDEMEGDTFKAKKEITSMMRRIVPMGVSTGGIWTANIRAIRHIISMRADGPAEEEIFYVWTNIAKYMIEQEDMLFADFEQTPEGYWRPRHWKV